MFSFHFLWDLFLWGSSLCLIPAICASWCNGCTEPGCQNFLLRLHFLKSDCKNTLKNNNYLTRVVFATWFTIRLQTLAIRIIRIFFVFAMPRLPQLRKTWWWVTHPWWLTHRWWWAHNPKVISFTFTWFTWMEISGFSHIYTFQTILCLNQVVFWGRVTKHQDSGEEEKAEASWHLWYWFVLACFMLQVVLYCSAPVNCLKHAFDPTWLKINTAQRLL